MEGVGSPRAQKATSPGASEAVINSPSGSSGKTKSSKFDEPRATTLNYEYQEQPTVKANLTPSELQFLDADTTTGATNVSTASVTSVTTTKSSRRSRPDRNANRFVASVLVMFTLGCFNMFVSSLYAYPSIRFLCGLLAAVGLFTTYEWHRIHGITLTRRLRPVLNMKSVFATYRNLDPDSACLYAADKDKFMALACCNVPEINNELPRTSDEKSPPSSPPNGTTTPTTATPSTSADSPAAAVTTATETQSPANPDVIKRSTEVNFQFPDSTAKDF